VLTRRSLAEDASKKNLARLAQRISDRYELELANHFQIEEETLFPAAGDLPLISQLVAEHREIERLVARLRSEATPELLEEFCALLTRHIRTEENDLFETLQRTLSRETLDRLGQVIDAQAVRICL
jgi:hemerythrin-like domain-containing protein